MNGKLLQFRPPIDRRTLSSEALVAACGTGDRAALGELFDRFHLVVYRFLSRYLRPGCSELDDLVQATFLEVLRSAPHFRKDSAVQSWIIGIAVNIARHHQRGESRRLSLWRRSGDPERVDAATPESASQRSELCGRLTAAVAELPESLRAPFILCEIEELPGAEAARLLNLREGTLWRRLHDARKLLRAVFRKGSE
jgi:RNA polymerase sigma-70 factor (ECF subfamily)